MVKKAKSSSSNHANSVQTVELLERRWLSNNAFEIQLSRPASFDFKPGQTLLLIYESTERHYSLISTPADSTLALCVQYIRQGMLSPILAAAEIGSQFKYSGPRGYFTFKPSHRDPVFVATGAGIAPFVSFARSGVSKFTLLHEVTAAEELYYQAYFRKVISTYYPCLPSAESADVRPEGMFQGHVAACLKANLPTGEYDFYLCGHREMTRNVTLLVDEWFSGSHVYTEVFF
jgi:benzoate/toluate 1,2-dioxygenase reductase subunit